MRNLSKESGGTFALQSLFVTPVGDYIMTAASRACDSDAAPRNGRLAAKPRPAGEMLKL
jgi:hypothetical protein